MWKEIISIMLFAVYTLSADELNEEDRTPILSGEGESFSEDADDSGSDEESPSASADEVEKRFLGIRDALRRINGALIGAVKGAVAGAVTGHMSASRPPANATTMTTISTSLVRFNIRH